MFSLSIVLIAVSLLILSCNLGNKIQKNRPEGELSSDKDIIDDGENDNSAEIDDKK